MNIVKKIITYTLMFAVVFSGFATSISYGANDSQRLQQIEQQKRDSAKKISQGKAKEKELNSQINSIEGKIKSTQGELSKLQSSINDTEANISKVQKELNKVESEMKAQDDSLNKRLRTMYMRNNASFLEILLGSENIVDFMSNMDIIQFIYDNDVELLNTIKKQREQIEVQKKNLEVLQAQLEKDKQAEASKQATLMGDKNEVVGLRQQVSSDIAQESKNLAALSVEAGKITAFLQSLQANNSNAGGPTVQYTGGRLGWPLPGSPGSYHISSEFGSRSSPINGRSETHLGIDIPAPKGTPVLAASSGTVVKAGFNGSYGYMVLIDHGGVATLYGHNSRLAVSTGSQVSKGQTISYVGSTGASTGNHLHFEVRKNGQPVNPRPWVM